jgi:hypothetical protein
VKPRAIFMRAAGFAAGASGGFVPSQY